MATKKQFPLSVVIGAVDRITAPMQRIQGKMKRFMVPVEKLRRSMRRLGQAAGFKRMGMALNRVRKATGRLVSSFGQMLKRLTAIAGIAGGLAVKMVIDFANLGDTAAKTARAIGLTAEQVQEWEFIADRSGVSTSVLNSSLIAFSKRLGEAKAGTGGLFTILKKTNPELLKQLQTTEDTSEAMALFLDHIGSYTDESKQAALAAAGFSRSGVKMVNVAKEGTDGIEALRREAHKLGLVISNESAKASETFVDRLTNMKAAMAGVRNIIGASLMPILQEFITRITEFVVKNQKQVKAWAEQFAKSLPTFDQVRKALLRVVDELRPLINLVRWMSDNFGVVNTLLLVFAATLGGQFVLAVLQAAAALKALGLAISLTPVGWFLAAIAAIAGAVYLIYKNWDGIAKYFTDKFARVKKAFKDGFLKGLWTLVTEFNPIQILIDTLDSLIEKLTGFSIKDAVKGLVQSISPFADDERESRRPAPRMRPGAGVLQSSRNGERSEAKVLVDFTNLPRGARVERDRTSTGDVDLSMGYQMQGAQ